MYKRILVAIENSAADRTILAHVEQLARLTGARLLLAHVADGWAARHFEELNLRESEEMRADRAYLEGLRKDLESRGLAVETLLGMGDPATEICRLAESQDVDLSGAGGADATRARGSASADVRVRAAGHGSDPSACPGRATRARPPASRRSRSRCGCRGGGRSRRRASRFLRWLVPTRCPQLTARVPGSRLRLRRVSAPQAEPSAWLGRRRPCGASVPPRPRESHSDLSFALP
jgi:nucleotide-binding universal stress UspA family protein